MMVKDVAGYFMLLVDCFLSGRNVGHTGKTESFSQKHTVDAQERCYCCLIGLENDKIRQKVL